MIRIGRVVGVFGIQGALKIELLTDLEGRFAPGAEVYLRQLEHRVEWSRPQGRGRVVKLSGLESRSAAEACRGCYLEAPALPDDRLAPEEWYHDQLLGLRVVTEGGIGLGVISEVLELPANDVWVASISGRETLIPATREAVLRVDVEAGEVRVANWLVGDE